MALIKSLFLLWALHVLVACADDRLKSGDLPQDYIDGIIILEASPDSSDSYLAVQFLWRYERPIQLSSPATISYQGEPLQGDFKSIGGGSNYSLRNFDWVRSNVFIYQDTEGRSFTNTLIVNEIDFPAADESFQVSRDQDWELEWVGRPIEENETIYLRLSSKIDPCRMPRNVSDAGDSNFSSDISGSQSVVIGSDDLQKLEAGFYYACITRAKEGDLEDWPIHGRGEYQTYYRSSIARIDLQ